MIHETAFMTSDNGVVFSNFYRLGFAAEAYPRKIIPSEVILSENGKINNIFDYKDSIDFYDHVVDFLQTIFFKYTGKNIVKHLTNKFFLQISSRKSERKKNCFSRKCFR